MPHDAESYFDQLHKLAEQVEKAGQDCHLPFVAVSADIGSPEAMIDCDGRPFAETLFRWVDPELEYWKDRGFALRSAFVHAARTCAEPFYFSDGQLNSWRTVAALEGLNAGEEFETFGVETAIIAPVHMPGASIGAVVWASDQKIEIQQVFESQSASLFALALKFIGTYLDAHEVAPTRPAVFLTRREIQCLKWAAAGKTDSEIAIIMDISVPTVRFHLTNSAKKLNVSGKARAIRRATALGYIGMA